MNCWGTAIKHVWGLHRATHKVYARWLGSGHTTIREDLLSRWPKLFCSLLNGPTPEVAILARVTTTAANNALILFATSLRTWIATADQVRADRAEEQGLPGSPEGQTMK